MAPLLGALILLGSAAAFLGCEDDGGVDEAVEEIEDEVGDAKQVIEDEVDDAKQEIEDEIDDRT